MAYNPNNANGQALSANSAPVVLASDQSTVPVSTASLPLPSGASTSAKQDTGNTSLASIDAKLTNPLPVSISSDIEIGAVELKNGTDDTRATVTASNALKVDGSAVTQPVSAASLPLPSGASTAAKQPALGTAGTAATDVITIQGIASMTKLLVTPDSVALPANQSVNVAQMNGVTTSMGSGIMGTGVQRVAIASDNDAVTVKQATGTNLHAVLDANSGVDIGKLTANQSVNLAQVAGGTAINSGVTGALATGGDTASDAVDAGNPLKIGGQARTTNPTAVADADRVNGIFDKLGKQISVGAIRELKGVTQTSVSNTTSETTVLAAVASTFLDVYGMVFANTGATTTKVTVKDATAGTTRMIFEVPTLETRGFMLPVDSAVPQAVVNNNWTVTCASATTAMEVTVFWVKNI